MTLIQAINGLYKMLGEEIEEGEKNWKNSKSIHVALELTNLLVERAKQLKQEEIDRTEQLIQNALKKRSE